MTELNLERAGAGASEELQRDLLRFRTAYPPKTLMVDGCEWQYYAGGQGVQVLAILPGGLRSGEAAFRLALALENDFRILALTYPPLPRIAQWVEGLKAILDAERIPSAHIFGSSAGGMLAQCFVRRYPRYVLKLVLGDTSLPDRERGLKYRRRSWLMPILPVGLARRLGRRSLPRLVAELPEDQRPFWLAYLSELLDQIYSRAWLVASSQVGIDYMLNYTFSAGDLKDWQGQMLIIDSDDDTVIGLQQLERVRALYPQAQRYTFHQAGHVPAITHEAEYIDLLRCFLKFGEVPHA